MPAPIAFRMLALVARIRRRGGGGCAVAEYSGRGLLTVVEPVGQKHRAQVKIIVLVAGRSVDDNGTGHAIDVLRRVMTCRCLY